MTPIRSASFMVNILRSASFMVNIQRIFGEFRKENAKNNDGMHGMHVMINGISGLLLDVGPDWILLSKSDNSIHSMISERAINSFAVRNNNK